jgi:two-component system chemotaxis response regulator CheY
MKTILVVDDFASVRFFHQSLLKQAGFATLPAPDGVEALAMLEKHPIDLIVLDLLMPKMNGVDFIQRIRADARFAKLPILVITSEAQNEQAKKLQGAPGISVMAKPILPAALIQDVRRLLPA